MMSTLLARRCALGGNRMTMRASSAATQKMTDHSRPDKAHIGKVGALPAVLNMATGTVSKSHWHTKHGPEVGKYAREHIPKYMAAVQGVLGLPGPRAIAFENEETKQWTGLMFWESHAASQKAQGSKEHAKLMEGFGPLCDTDKKQEDAEMLHADFHYWAPIKECNYERYPIEVGVYHLVKPGFREFLRKQVESNGDLAKWCNECGVLFAALTWNDAEDKFTVYVMYNDLLKWEAKAEEWPKKFEAWGMAEFMDLENCTQAIHSNCFMYSE